MPARQRLLMEMMQADIQEQQHMLLQQRQHQHHQQQQQFLLQQATKSASALDPSLVRPMTRSSLSGLPPTSPLWELFPSQKCCPAPPPWAHSFPPLLAWGQPRTATTLVPLGAVWGQGAPLGCFPGDGWGGWFACSGVNGCDGGGSSDAGGHRQLHPSAVDPLDVYLARQQRMQQQQLQLQQEEEHQQQQQQVRARLSSALPSCAACVSLTHLPLPALSVCLRCEAVELFLISALPSVSVFVFFFQAAVDFQMYQAILKRQQQAP